MITIQSILFPRSIGLAAVYYYVLFSRVLHPMTFHDVPFLYPKVIDSVALPLTSTVRGYPAETTSRLRVSYIHHVTFPLHVQLSALKILHAHFICHNNGRIFCLVNLVPEPVDAAYDVKLGTLISDS